MGLAFMKMKIIAEMIIENNSASKWVVGKFYVLQFINKYCVISSKVSKNKT